MSQRQNVKVAKHYWDKSRSSKTLQDRNVTVVKGDRRRNIGWMFCAGQNVAWLYCGRTYRQGTYFICFWGLWQLFLPSLTAVEKIGQVPDDSSNYLSWSWWLCQLFVLSLAAWQLVLSLTMVASICSFRDGCVNYSSFPWWLCNYIFVLSLTAIITNCPLLQVEDILALSGGGRSVELLVRKDITSSHRSLVHLMILIVRIVECFLL